MGFALVALDTSRLCAHSCLLCIPFALHPVHAHCWFMPTAGIHTALFAQLFLREYCILMYSAHPQPALIFLEKKHKLAVF